MLTLTPIVWIVRSGSSHEVYGDPYEGVATIQRCGDVAYISAACGELPIGDQLELKKRIREMGFKTAVYDRVIDGRVKRFKWELNRPQEV